MNQDTTPMTTVEEVVQESTKRKRQMSEKQLEALAVGRKKRWLKKQEEGKEEKKESTYEESSEECTEESSTEGEESKTESESESVPSVSSAEDLVLKKKQRKVKRVKRVMKRFHHHQC